MEVQGRIIQALAKMEYPNKYIIAYIIVILSTTLLLALGFNLILRLIRNSHLMERLMIASISCIISNFIFEICFAFFNILDGIYSFDYNREPYPNQRAINVTICVCIAMFSMMLFNAFLFDIYKWGLFIVSSNQKLRDSS